MESAPPAPARGAKLVAHLEAAHGRHVWALQKLDAGVYRVDWQEGGTWVARLFSAFRPLADVEGDATVLRFLEEAGYPAERCTGERPVTSLGRRGLLVTGFVEGTPPAPGPRTAAALGDLLGRLHALQPGPRSWRAAGSLHHWSPAGGPPAADLAAARSWLADVEEKGLVTGESRAMHEDLVERVEACDDAAGLPEALVHPDFVPKNVLATKSGMVLVDWTGAGRGPRAASLASMLWSVGLRHGGTDPAAIDAAARAYRTHVQPEPDELDRLEDVMAIRPVVFACWRYALAMARGEPPRGDEYWWHDDGLAADVAAQASSVFVD
jgi:Ser/Thr protein kinase RdoA (MazF antagonist)